MGSYQTLSPAPGLGSGHLTAGLLPNYTGWATSMLLTLTLDYSLTKWATSLLLTLTLDYCLLTGLTDFGTNIYCEQIFFS